MSAPVPSSSSSTSSSPPVDGSRWNSSNYHWEEKNYSSWAKERFPILISNIKLGDGTSSSPSISFTVGSLEGDAYANIRKGKKIVGFDMKANIEWTAKGKDGDNEWEANGALKLPNIAEDVDDGDWEVSDITSRVNDKNHENSLEIIRKAGRVKIREVIDAFVKELRNLELK